MVTIPPEIEEAVLIRSLCQTWNMSRAEVLASDVRLLRDTQLVRTFDRVMSEWAARSGE